MITPETPESRIVQAPESDPGTCAINSVTLAPDEDVEWTWSQSADGKKYVSGYLIRKK